MSVAVELLRVIRAQIEPQPRPRRDVIYVIGGHPPPRGGCGLADLDQLPEDLEALAEVGDERVVREQAQRGQAVDSARLKRKDKL